MRMTLGRAASACLTAVLALSVAEGARADNAYVIEQLVVSVASEPGGEGEKVGQVKSGDKLEVLERQADESHVKLGNGKDGWIKSSYLTTEAPLQTRLAERNTEIDKLKQDNEHLKQEADKGKQELDKVKQDAARLEAELSSARATRSGTSDAPPPPSPLRETVFLSTPDRNGSTPWSLLIGISAVMLLAGFALGWKMLDRRIRQKYGGLRIY